jgi:uncharacterized protein
VTTSDRLRFVCDTNVLVSAILFPQSVPGQAFASARRMGVLLASRDLAEKIRDVLIRPKFDRYVSSQMRDAFLAAFVAEAAFVEVVDRVNVCRDPKDNVVLEVASNGHATCVISGDEDLLALHPFQSIPILRPADFVARYGGTQP